MKDFDDLSDFTDNRYGDDANVEESFKKNSNQENKRHDARRRIDDLLEAKRLRQDINGFDGHNEREREPEHEDSEEDYIDEDLADDNPREEE